MRTFLRTVLRGKRDPLPDPLRMSEAELGLTTLLVEREYGSELEHQQCFDKMTDDELVHYVVRLGELHGRAHVELERRQRSERR